MLSLEDYKTILAALILLFIIDATLSASERPIRALAFSHVSLDEDKEPSNIDVEYSSWLDINGEFEVSEILLNSATLKKAKGESILEPNSALWTFIRFENRGNNKLGKHIQFDFYVENIAVFVLKDGQIDQELRSGKSMLPPQKAFHSTNNYIPISVNAGEATEIIIRQYVLNNAEISALTSLKIHQSSELYRQRLMTFSMQAFYLGLLLIMSIVGIVKGLLVKRKSYIYFALFTLSLGLFFPFYHGLLDDLFLYVLHNKYIDLGEFIFSGIILFGFLFFSKYYGLKSHSPQLYRVFLSITVLSEVSAYFMFLFMPEFSWLFHIRYFIVSLWISLIMYFTIKQINKDKRKRQTLICLAITMSISLFIVVISIFEPKFYDFYIYSGFQIATFCFTAILFYDLFKAKSQVLEVESVGQIEVPQIFIEEAAKAPSEEPQEQNLKNEIDLLLENAKPADKELLDKVCQSIEAHMSDPAFSVEILAKEIGYSQAHLNRKLKASCNLSANKFALSYRLYAAYEMLESGSSNVSEAAHKTGFSSTSYFVKCFKDKFGTTPGKLVKE